MEKEFTVGYSYKTFGGIIGVGTFDVEADSIEDVKSGVFAEILRRIKEDSPYDDFQNIQCSVSEKESK